jgi:hypothetical protein
VDVTLLHELGDGVPSAATNNTDATESRGALTIRPVSLGTETVRASSECRRRSKTARFELVDAVGRPSRECLLPRPPTLFGCPSASYSSTSPGLGDIVGGSHRECDIVGSLPSLPTIEIEHFQGRFNSETYGRGFGPSIELRYLFEEERYRSLILMQPTRPPLNSWTVRPATG